MDNNAVSVCTLPRQLNDCLHPPSRHLYNVWMVLSVGLTCRAAAEDAAADGLALQPADVHGVAPRILEAGRLATCQVRAARHAQVGALVVPALFRHALAF